MCDIHCEQSKRIQVLRGLAILSVVFYHILPYGQLQVIMGPFLTFGVALFLFLSGLLTKANGCIRWGRIKKVIIPYLIWTVLYTVVRGKINFLFYNLFTAEACAILYYIFVYIQFVLFSPLIEKLAEQKYRWIGFVFSPISIVLFKYIPFFTGYKLNEFFSVLWNDSFIPWFSFYYLGILLRNNYININKASERKYTLLYVVSIMFQIIESVIWMTMGSTNIASHLKLSSIFTSCIVCMIAFKYIYGENREILIPKYRKAFNDFFVEIGNASFGIYLSHIMIHMAFGKIIPGYTVFPYVCKSLMVFFSSLICVKIAETLLGKYGKYLGFF